LKKGSVLTDCKFYHIANYNNKNNMPWRERSSISDI